jgi:DNA-directed RNA polymerase subunit RPC12/RpoP
MGFKNVCVTCRKAFKTLEEIKNRKTVCPECAGEVILVSHRFKPPRKSDDKQWKLVAYMLDNGFRYEHTYDNNNGNILVPYPHTMEEAKEFVFKFGKPPTN